MSALRDKKFLDDLCDDAARRYRPAGRFALHFARGKLGGDAMFGALLKNELIVDGARIVDIGCGQGLLAAWLLAARAAYVSGTWPMEWPMPPRFTTLHGTDRSHADVARATAALGALARFTRADLRDPDAPTIEACDVVVLLDVLHYLEPAVQDRLLVSVRNALAPDGVLLMRVGNADARLRSGIANGVDLLVSALRGNPLARLYRRPVSVWVAALAHLGFGVETITLGNARHDANANVLLAARLERPCISGSAAALR